MGVYDTVEVPCPKCGKIEYFQSKSGERLMENYTLQNVPDDVLIDINRHAPYRCKNCQTLFLVNPIALDGSMVWKTTYDPNSLYGEENNE